MEQLTSTVRLSDAPMTTLADLAINVYEELPVVPDISDSLLMFIQEIWMCFNIDKYEMISDTKSGNLRLQEVLFNRNVSSAMLRNLINDEIKYNCSGASTYKYEISVKFAAATVRDIVVIDVTVYDTHHRPFTQRFLYQ